ncbi:MAG TPA: hypothetical protein IGR64_12355 [Leptolyngbyaceae cyanobacterium M65_K2018_010]|nr:hypothetical protein [Leptolyngbyaceae cyanobacterium M65_K2018_010]
MDITDSTKALIQHIQPLKLKHSDLVSRAFIDFYCQCHQGMDYLLPAGMRDTIRLVDILQWFFQCIDQGRPLTLIDLMWKDVVGPTLSEYRADEAIEQELLGLFERGDLKAGLSQWDLQRRPDGGVNLPLRTLLEDIDQIEQAQRHP